jgi:hypothetical protein
MTAEAINSFRVERNPIGKTHVGYIRTVKLLTFILPFDYVLTTPTVYPKVVPAIVTPTWRQLIQP